MEQFGVLVEQIRDFMWGWPLLIMLLGTHLFLTFRLRFIQLHTPKAIKLSVTKDRESQGEISQFSALATSLAATVGTGNIVGVATAVAVGGPGAVLWTWLTGVLGIATKYAEGVLAVKYRVKNKDGSFSADVRPGIRVEKQTAGRFIRHFHRGSFFWYRFFHSGQFVDCRCA